MRWNLKRVNFWWPEFQKKPMSDNTRLQQPNRRHTHMHTHAHAHTHTSTHTHTLWLEVRSIRWMVEETGGGGTMPCWELPCQAVHQSEYTPTYLPTVPHQWAGSVYLSVCKPTNQTTEWGHRRRRRRTDWQRAFLENSSSTLTAQTCDVQELSSLLLFTLPLFPCSGTSALHFPQCTAEKWHEGCSVLQQNIFFILLALCDVIKKISSYGHLRQRLHPLAFVFQTISKKINK